MPLAIAAEDFRPFCKKTDIFFENDIVNVDRIGKAGPAGVRFKFSLGAEKRLSAAGTDIGAFFGGVPIGAGKGFFSPFFT